MKVNESKIIESEYHTTQVPSYILHLIQLINFNVCAHVKKVKRCSLINLRFSGIMLLET